MKNNFENQKEISSNELLNEFENSFECRLSIKNINELLLSTPNPNTTNKRRYDKYDLLITELFNTDKFCDSNHEDLHKFSEATQIIMGKKITNKIKKKLLIVKPKIQREMVLFLDGKHFQKLHGTI